MAIPDHHHITVDLDITVIEESKHLPTTVAEAVSETRMARHIVRSLSTALQAAMMTFEAEHVDLINALSQARDRQQAMEETTRMLGLAAWTSYQEQEPHPSKMVYPGVQIREKIQLIYDEAEALAWAQAGNKLAIQPECLNVPAFETLAKRFPEQVPFVRQAKTYQVTLAKEL